MDSAAQISGKYLRFTDFSVFPSPRPNWVMVMLRAYFDDSGEEMDPQHKACSLFGYATDGTKWPIFEMAWQTALDNTGMPYFHMKEFAHFNGPFAPFRDDEKARIKFVQDLGAAIGSVGLQGFGSTIRLADLRKFNQERGYQINDYALTHLTDNDRFPFPCAGCGEDLKKTIGWMKANSRAKCACCGRNTYFDKATLEWALKEFEQTISDFARHARLEDN